MLAASAQIYLHSEKCGGGGVMAAGRRRSLKNTALIRTDLALRLTRLSVRLCMSVIDSTY